MPATVSYPPETRRTILPRSTPTNVYRRNRTTGVTDLASHVRDGQPADGDSFGAAVSPDGLHVGFTSTAGNLVPGDANHRQDVFMRR